MVKCDLITMTLKCDIQEKTPPRVESNAVHRPCYGLDTKFDKFIFHTRQNLDPPSSKKSEAVMSTDFTFEFVSIF
jgi:hypothetical protein